MPLSAEVSSSPNFSWYNSVQADQEAHHHVHHGTGLAAVLGVLHQRWQWPETPTQPRCRRPTAALCRAPRLDPLLPGPVPKNPPQGWHQPGLWQALDTAPCGAKRCGCIGLHAHHQTPPLHADTEAPWCITTRSPSFGYVPNSQTHGTFPKRVFAKSLKKIKNKSLNPWRAAKYPHRRGKLQHLDVTLIFNLGPIMKYRIILIWANCIDQEIYCRLL